MDLSTYASMREAGTAPRGARLKAIAVLRAIVDLFAFNLALLVVCLPIVTAPAAFQAGIVALERWRNGGEDHVVREFAAVLRSRTMLRTTLSAGVPFAAAAVALEEVHFFLGRGTVVGSLCLGLGVAGLLVSLAGLGYTLVLGARQPELAPTDLWRSSVSFAVRNLLGPSMLLVAEFAAVALLLLRDPLLALTGLPVALLSLVRLTADRGIRPGEGRTVGREHEHGAT
jgi:hypothetical protein